MKYIICPNNAPLETFGNLEKAKKRAKELGLNLFVDSKKVNLIIMK